MNKTYKMLMLSTILATGITGVMLGKRELGNRKLPSEWYVAIHNASSNAINVKIDDEFRVIQPNDWTQSKGRAFFQTVDVLINGKKINVTNGKPRVKYDNSGTITRHGPHEQI